MTKAEIILWSKIKNSTIGYKFRRQHGIGRYIVDFYCPKLRLIVELDGPIHGEEERIEYDKEREKYLKDLKLNVKRYQNEQILKNIEGALIDLLRTCRGLEKN